MTTATTLRLQIEDSLATRFPAALALLAQATAQGWVCTWVDASDTLDPASAAASGIHLLHLLWIHCTPLSGSSSPRNKREQKRWTHLDQALRIPLTTWFRFRLTAERSA